MFLTWVGCPLGKILIYQNLQIERTKNPLSILGFFNICPENKMLKYYKNTYLSHILQLPLPLSYFFQSDFLIPINTVQGYSAQILHSG